MDYTLLLVGGVVSLVVQVSKKYFGTNKAGTLSTVLGLSLVAGAGSWYLQHAGLWDSFIQILAAAGAVYAFIMKTYQDISEQPTV